MRSPTPVHVLGSILGGNPNKENENARQRNLQNECDLEELGGPGGVGANPEKLFAAGYSACFLGAMKAVSGKENVRVPADATVTATIGFGPRSDGGYGITADLLVDLPGIDRADAERLVKAAHEVCPYSNATRGNLDVGLSVA
jgi:lipoyl-dependent peroxiredoxin